MLFDCVSLKVLENNSRKIQKLPAALIGGAEIALRDQMDCLTSSPHSVLFAVLDLHVYSCRADIYSCTLYCRDTCAYRRDIGADIHS